MPEPSRVERLRAAVSRIDETPRLVTLARAARRRLPGDEQYGDPLSLAGDEPPQVVARVLSEAGEARPSALRELGMSALQVWQSLGEAQGRGAGEQDLAIVFTDLVEFSTWALEVGDEPALELLRNVGMAIEPCVRACDGRVVKRIGDGMMAVFEDPAAAVQAAHRAVDAAAGVEVEGYTPRLRAGVHVGRPRALGGDYYGVAVNVAARIAAAAGPGEVLVSDVVRDRLDGEQVSVKRKWRFKGKGAPRELRVYLAEPVG
jgi:adenylate cyclase